FEIVGLGLRRHLVGDRFDVGLLRVAVLEPDVGSGRGVVSDEDDGEARLDALVAKDRDAVLEFRPDLFRDLLAVDDLRHRPASYFGPETHVGPPRYAALPCESSWPIIRATREFRPRRAARDCDVRMQAAKPAR